MKNKSFAEQAAEELKQARYRMRLAKRFPDLQERADRWGHKRLHSKSINSICTKVMIKHDCGCCDDSPLYVWPYITLGDVRVYSDQSFCVGEKYYCWDRPNEGWQKKLREANIDNVVINQISEYFERNVCDDEDE